MTDKPGLELRPYRTQDAMIAELIKRYHLDKNAKAALLEAVKSERQHFAEICLGILNWKDATETEKSVARWIASRARGDIADREATR